MKSVFRLAIYAVVAFASCTGNVYSDSAAIRIASATTIENSGLFDNILPVFTEQTGISVHVLSVGTGNAIRLAKAGDADILLGHHQPSEQQFVDQGYGVERVDIMYNDFVLVGPAVDPANVSGITNIHQALEQIAQHQNRFVSRGDESGTHLKEQSIWRNLEVDVSRESGTWYYEAGTGMGATLTLANALGAYTLSDRGTWLRHSRKTDLALMVEGDPALFNQYGVTLVNPIRHPHINAEAGRTFIHWLTSDSGQLAIDTYLIAGEQAFFANAGRTIRFGQNTVRQSSLLDN